jgi:predicted lipoprotein with Yx(FWY)xxD motif
MRRVTFLGVLFGLALIVAACAPATPTQAPTVSVPVTGDTAIPEVVMTDTPAETATSEATEAPTQAPTEAATEAGMTTTGSAISIMTSTNASVSEPFLVDQSGRTLYVFAKDTQNSGTSACTGDCATIWLPVTVTATPTAGTGVDASMLGAITRDDGTMQATFNGWPLYYYSGDQAAGDMMGQGMEGNWFLVSATGNAIKP